MCIRDRHVIMHIPYQQTGIYSLLMKHARVITRTDEEDGMQLEVVISDHLYQKYQEYVTAIRT